MTPSTIERILVGLDGSPLAESVLPVVEPLAHGLDAEVVLLHVTNAPALSGLDEVARANARRAEAYLAARRAILEEAGLRAGDAVAEGAAPVEIVRYAEGNRVDCIALATHGRSGLGRWLHGSVADEVLHTTRTPLLLVRPDPAGAAGPRSLTRIVVPLDGSEMAESALPMAVMLAGRLSLPLVLLRVVDLVGFDFMSGEIAILPILTQLEQDARGYLARVATAWQRAGRPIETLVLAGPPAGGIAGYAADHPGALTVMTTHARRGLSGLVLGSVARRTVQQASRAVLLLRPS